MGMITSSTNALKAFQNLSDNDKFVLSKDGSNVHKTSTWQNIKNFLGTSGAKALNQRTVAGLKNLIACNPLYAGALETANAELDALSDRGVAVSGKFVRSLFTKLNLEANCRNLRLAASNRLAIVMGGTAEGAEKTPIQQKLETVRGYAESAGLGKNALDARIKKCVESQLAKELLSGMDENGALKADHEMPTVDALLDVLLEDIAFKYENNPYSGNAERTCEELLAPFDARGVSDDELARLRDSVLERGDAARPDGAQNRADCRFEMPDSIAGHAKLEIYNVSKEAFQRVYTLERQLMKTDAQILQALNDGTVRHPPLLRMALNPQYLTDMTSYAKGKALIENKFKSSNGDEMWGVKEAARKKADFCRRTMSDEGLVAENRRLAEKLGLKPNTSAFDAVVKQLTRLSAHQAFGKFEICQKAMARHYIGKGPKNARTTNMRLSDPVIAPPSDFALEKRISATLIDKFATLMTRAEPPLGDQEKTVLAARIFNKSTISKLEDYVKCLKDPAELESAIQKKLAGYLQEARDVVDVFKDDTAAIDAFCLQMNCPSVSDDMHGKALSRKAIEALHAHVDNVKSWADGISLAKRPISIDDIRNFYANSIVKSPDPELRKLGAGLDEMALGMVKTMGGFKIGDTPGWKPLLKLDNINQIVKDFAEDFGKVIEKEGLGTVLKRTINLLAVEKYDEELIEKNAIRQDGAKYLKLAAVSSEMTEQLMMLGVLAITVNYAVSGDEGVEFDVEGMCGVLMSHGRTDQTSCIPLPGYDEEEAEQNDPVSFGKNSLFNMVTTVEMMQQKVPDMVQ